MTPFFSVIIPVCSAEAYLAQCVESLLGQDCGDFELILVDDGSTDGSGALCGEYAAKDKRVTALHQENAGPTPARRRGLALARGEYVCFVDADDWVVPGYFRVLRGCIDQYDPDIVLFDLSRDVGEADQPLYAEAGFYDRARMAAEIWPHMLMDFRRKPFGQQLFPGYLWSRAVRRTLLAEHFITEDRLTVFEDTAMSYECVYHAKSLYVTHDKLYVYRRLAQSNLRHYRPDYFQEASILYDYLQEHLGRLDPALAKQVNGFCSRRVIGGIVNEYDHLRDVGAAARNAGRALDETGFAKRLTLHGLPPYMKVYLTLVKLRLYRLAALAVKLTMD